MLSAFGVTDRGRIRPTNEDCFGIDPHLQLCVVADGMGGHNAGEVASRMAVETVLDYVANSGVSTTWPYGFDPARSERANLLRTAVEVANARVFEAAAATHQYAGMGTTIVAALVSGGVLTVAHVGDSRLYAVEAEGARQLTVDDSWMAAMLARDPGLDPAALRAHPMRNALTSVVGARPTVTVHVSERMLPASSVLVLTTDGVHGVLNDHFFLAECARPCEPQEVAERLVRAALVHGSRDNCTAVVARYQRDPAQ
jgi:PPM family protein phosphatase